MSLVHYILNPKGSYPLQCRINSTAATAAMFLADFSLNVSARYNVSPTSTSRTVDNVICICCCGCVCYIYTQLTDIIGDFTLKIYKIKLCLHSFCRLLRSEWIKRQWTLLNAKIICYVRYNIKYGVAWFNCKLTNLTFKQLTITQFLVWKKNF